MTDEELQEHIALLRRVRTDFRHVEAKLAWGGLLKRLWETLSAFANTSGGGVIILGLDEGANSKWSGSKSSQDTPGPGQHDGRHGATSCSGYRRRRDRWSGASGCRSSGMLPSQSPVTTGRQDIRTVHLCELPTAIAS